MRSVSESSPFGLETVASWGMCPQTAGATILRQSFPTAADLNRTDPMLYPSHTDTRHPAALAVRASAWSVCCLLLASVLTGCGEPETAKQAAEPPAVGVIEVGEQKVNPFFEFVGKTQAAESVALRARVTGFLEERNFQEGGEVERDQVLFKIEPQQYRATLAQAEASLGAAEASLNQAEVDLKRYQELRKTNNVSQQEVDKTQALVLVRQAEVETAKADIEKAKLNVDYTEIVAPIAGRIDASALDVGNLIGPDAGVLATINRMDPIKATFAISETWYYELIQAENEAERQGRNLDDFSHVPLIRLPDGSLYEHQGMFDFVDNKVDQKTGTVTVRAVFPNPDRLLLPGQFVTIVIERVQAVDRVLIPQAAVLTDQGGAYVLAVNDKDVVEARRIQTGQRFGPNLVVEEGLAPGERIVLYGIQKVRPGLTVTPELAEAPSDPMDNATTESVTEEAAADDAEAVEEAAGGGETMEEVVSSEGGETQADADPETAEDASDAAE
jgi:membrane fusion protein (multidrug efflux system)